MPDLSSILHQGIDGSVETLNSLRRLEEPMRRAADAIAHCLGSGHKLLLCGNGGSAADAAHFATEFVIRFMASERPAFPAICLTSDGGSLTAAGNDFGFNEIFARQVAAFGRAGDILICLTTSGNSANIQRAIAEAKARAVTTIALLGNNGGVIRNTADIELLVESDSTARIQEAHMFLLHVLCEAMEERLSTK